MLLGTQHSYQIVETNFKSDRIDSVDIYLMCKPRKKACAAAKAIRIGSSRSSPPTKWPHPTKPLQTPASEKTYEVTVREFPPVDASISISLF